MAQLQINDYTKHFDEDLVRTGSPLHDFPFTDSLTFDSQYEVDSSPVYTAGLFRTSRGPDRVQLATFNELGAQQGGVYIYSDGLIATAYTEGTVFFYDNSGSISSVIQQPTPGQLTMSSTDVDLIATSEITLDAPLTNITGELVIDGISASTHIGILDPTTAPAAIPGLAQIYVDVADNDLKVKFGNGNVAVLAAN